jgi:hypothetical protein
MKKDEQQPLTCPSCNFFGYCQIYWGSKCKRQGGTKIPRMKAMSREQKQKLRKKKEENHRPKHDMPEIFESICTKVTHW